MILYFNQTYTEFIKSFLIFYAWVYAYSLVLRLPYLTFTVFNLYLAIEPYTM